MNQPQREALIDLLNLAILSDSHISLKEDESLQAAFEALGWESERPQEIHSLNSISRARHATDSAETMQQFLASRVAVFASSADQRAALDSLKSVLGSDGLSEEEAGFLKLVEQAFPAAN